MLQDLYSSLLSNDALRKCQDMVSKEMGRVTGGLNIREGAASDVLAKADPFWISVSG